MHFQRKLLQHPPRVGSTPPYGCCTTGNAAGLGLFKHMGWPKPLVLLPNVPPALRRPPLGVVTMSKIMLSGCAESPDTPPTRRVGRGSSSCLGCPQCQNQRPPALLALMPIRANRPDATQRGRHAPRSCSRGAYAEDGARWRESSRGCHEDSEQPTAPQQRRDPAEDVQALPVGAARGHTEALSALRPTSSQAGV